MTDAPTPLSKALARMSQTLREEIVPIIGRLPKYARLVFALATDARISAKDRGALLLAIGYQVSPVDLVPGFIPIIGQLDDLLVLFWGLRRTLDSFPPERAAEYLAHADLTREQLDADTAVVRQAFKETAGRSAKIVGRGLLQGVMAGITAGAYVSFLAYYAVKDLVDPRGRIR